jgi:hypothetical protein
MSQRDTKLVSCRRHRSRAIEAFHSVSRAKFSVSPMFAFCLLNAALSANLYLFDRDKCTSNRKKYYSPVAGRQPAVLPPKPPNAKSALLRHPARHSDFHIRRSPTSRPFTCSGSVRGNSGSVRDNSRSSTLFSGGRGQSFGVREHDSDEWCNSIHRGKRPVRGKGESFPFLLIFVPGG